MTTYDDLKAKVLRTLKDATGKTYDLDLLYDGFLTGHQEILPWVPKMAVATLTSGSAGGALLLPADCYQVDAVQDLRDFKFIPKATLAPKVVRTGLTGSTVDWTDYPTGYVSISEDLASGVSFKLFYRAYWGVPTSGSDGAFVIEVPQHAHTGLVYRVCAHVVLPRAVTSSGIRQFNTKVDSGNPEDNPLFEISDYFLKQFYNCMKMSPPYTKAVQV